MGAEGPVHYTVDMATVQRSPEAVRHDHLLQELLGQVSSYNSKLDVDLIRRAFDFACDQHAGQLRKSGEDFIHHPWSTAQVCAGMKLDSSTIAAALMHDVIEDTDADLEQVRELFGDEVALLVEGVTKLSKINFASREQAQAENYRKMVMAMAQDVRVVLIKLADRLHNMRTIDGAAEAEADQQGPRDARDLRAAGPPAGHPLHQVGARGPRVPDAAPAPVRRDRVDGQPAPRRPRALRRGGLDHPRRASWTSTGVEADISGRAKHFYSIYAKMAQGGKEFNEIYDLTAMRVLVDSVKDCYGAIGVIHSLWKPMPGRFKDYVAMPKSNMYQSLHTTVIGPEGKPLEIQVRTQRCTRPPSTASPRTGSTRTRAPRRKDGSLTPWLTQLMDWQNDATDPKEFMETLRVDLFSDEVYVFTPKGEVKSLPAGVDAARLRLRGAHRRRAPLCRRQGQRPHRAAALRACTRATSSRC